MPMIVKYIRVVTYWKKKAFIIARSSSIGDIVRSHVSLKFYISPRRRAIDIGKVLTYYERLTPFKP